MKDQNNSRVVGAIVVGFALVFGAYTISNFGKSNFVVQPASVLDSNSTARVAIAVVDNDENGIEDWRDDFVIATPIVLDKAESDYVPPDTLTGQMSISFMEEIIRSRGYGPFGSSKEEIIKGTVDTLGKETNISLYDTKDIIILEGWTDENVITYANTAALVMINNSVPDLESELYILNDILRNENTDREIELKTLATVYKNYREGMLQTPVPGFLVKEHLDLINTFHALYNDIDAMTKALSDPAVTLLRLKRYEDDALGMAYALNNMYEALESHASLFTTDDPALLFTAFNINYQVQ